MVEKGGVMKKQVSLLYKKMLIDMSDDTHPYQTVMGIGIKCDCGRYCLGKYLLWMSLWRGKSTLERFLLEDENKILQDSIKIFFDQK